MKKSMSMFAIALLILSACGKEKVETQMSEQQALDVLNGSSDTENGSARSGWFSKKPKKPTAPPVDYAAMMQLISSMAASGQITADPNSLASLTSVLNSVSGGNTNSTLALALSIMSQVSASGGVNGGTIDLNTVIQILQQVAPMIAVVAPQYAPVIQALLVILPIVQALLNQANVPHATLDAHWAYNYI